MELAARACRGTAAPARRPRGGRASAAPVIAVRDEQRGEVGVVVAPPRPQRVAQHAPVGVDEPLVGVDEPRRRRARRAAPRACPDASGRPGRTARSARPPRAPAAARARSCGRSRAAASERDTTKRVVAGRPRLDARRSAPGAEQSSLITQIQRVVGLRAQRLDLRAGTAPGPARTWPCRPRSGPAPARPSAGAAAPLGDRDPAQRRELLVAAVEPRRQRQLDAAAAARARRPARRPEAAAERRRGLQRANTSGRGIRIAAGRCAAPSTRISSRRRACAGGSTSRSRTPPSRRPPAATRAAGSRGSPRDRRARDGEPILPRR